eukprot:TRINITY_DN47017_c0_g1_i1.p1 TRINITY_DN47017_c0_g1~~TRINITY_DN47017_c0_g1_i1.p1  ORF type:complete len:198 (+),score=68.05 TRINITY_DN47017_c0_g1_i1:87-596(+)
MSLWKTSQLGLRTQWARSMDPRLDKRAGPLEVEKGITWRSVLKYNAWLLSLAGVIAWANGRAYEAHWQQSKGTANPYEVAEHTKQQLRDGAEDKVKLNSRELMREMYRKVQEETDNWNPDKFAYKKIDRPPELTLDNLRESGSMLTSPRDMTEQQKKLLAEAKAQATAE